VNLDKLTKKLSRDLTANPKKAGLLGLMVLVALYFWAPLLKGAVLGKGGASTSQTAQVILTDDPLEAGAAPRKPKETLKWEKLRQLVETDSKMASVAYNAQWRDPFTPSSAPNSTVPEPASVVVETLDSVMVEPEPAVDADPTELGLSVASVMIGPRTRAVTIAGDVYRESETIVATTRDGQGVEYRIVAIHATEVHFERNGKTYRVELSRPNLAKGDRIGRISAGGN
jgi:hypothetical protein